MTGAQDSPTPRARHLRCGARARALPQRREVLDFPAVAVESSTRLIAALAALGGQSGSLTAFLAVVLPLRLALGRAVDLAGDYLDLRGGGRAQLYFGYVWGACGVS